MGCHCDFRAPLRRGLGRVLLCLLSALALPGPATFAAGLNGKLTLASGYNFRGMDRSGTGLIPQGTLRVDLPKGLFAGVWASRLDLDDNNQRTRELDIFAGVTVPLTQTLSTSVSVNRYSFNQGNGGTDYDWTEVAARLFIGSRTSVSAARGKGWLGHGQDPHSHVLDARHILPLGRHYTADLTLGYVDLEEALDLSYWYYQAGISRSFDAWSLRAHVVASSSDLQDRLGSRGETQWVFTLNYHFGW